MTLYWYMHWFWITYYAVSANVTNTTEHSIYQTGSGNYSLEDRGSATTVIPPGDDWVAPAALGKYKSLKKHLSINNTEVNESVIESEGNNNNSSPLSNLTVNPSNRSDLIENFTSYYEATCNNHSEVILNSEQREANDSLEKLSAAGITGITLSCVFVVGVVMILSYIVYKNRGFNRPQVLNDHCSNLDSSGYIDDTSVRDNSEEMYSLDNDSFLNSLEAMTIQNYWTDTVKHTKL